MNYKSILLYGWLLVISIPHPLHARKFDSQEISYIVQGSGIAMLLILACCITCAVGRQLVISKIEDTCSLLPVDHTLSQVRSIVLWARLWRIDLNKSLFGDPRVPFLEYYLKEHYSAAKPEVVEWLVYRGLRVSPRLFTNSEAVRYHYSYSHPQVIDLLLQHGASATLTGRADQETPLHAMIEGNAPQGSIAALIKHGANVNAVNAYNGTPLHYACEKKRLDVAKLLIENGAHISAKDNFGMTALHFACRAGGVDLARYLLSCGATIPSCYEDQKATTPLYCAARSKERLNGDLSLLYLLLRSGANMYTEDIKKGRELNLLPGDACALFDEIDRIMNTLCSSQEVALASSSQKDLNELFFKLPLYQKLQSLEQQSWLSKLIPYPDCMTSENREYALLCLPFKPYLLVEAFLALPPQERRTKVHALLHILSKDGGDEKSYLGRAILSGICTAEGSLRYAQDFIEYCRQSGNEEGKQLGINYYNVTQALKESFNRKCYKTHMLCLNETPEVINHILKY